MPLMEVSAPARWLVFSNFFPFVYTENERMKLDKRPEKYMACDISQLQIQLIVQKEGL